MESENKIQAESFKWLWNNRPKTRRLFFSIPNGGLRTTVGAKTLEATGALPGTPDTLLAKPGRYQGRQYPVMFIEFKTESGKLSPEQEKCHTALREAGNGVIIIRSLEAFKQFISEYID